MSRRKTTGISPMRALDVTGRATAAVFGGYALAALVAAACARWLPVARVEAVVAGMLVSFAVYALVAIFAFASRSAARAWIGMAAIGVPLAVALAASLHGAAA
ncbi:DUF3649 domain-containing protein [Xanthomonas sp. NCPPB 2632]|uniref:DUF3649 domain-containing protein n=1 Tax=Xanthomonas sp. NCPPB 2632 TaxID=3240912 RepID=UPI0035194E4A